MSDPVRMAVEKATKRDVNTGRTPTADETFTEIDAENGHICAGACDEFEFEVVNTDSSNPLTVTAARKAAGCPKCGSAVDPAGKGAVTVLAGKTGALGPLPASLYGQGDSGTDVHLDITGTGTGMIRARPVR